MPEPVWWLDLTDPEPPYFTTDTPPERLLGTPLCSGSADYGVARACVRYGFEFELVTVSLIIMRGAGPTYMPVTSYARPRASIAWLAVEITARPASLDVQAFRPNTRRAPVEVRAVPRPGCKTRGEAETRRRPGRVVLRMTWKVWAYPGRMRISTERRRSINGAAG